MLPIPPRSIFAGLAGLALVTAGLVACPALDPDPAPPVEHGPAEPAVPAPAPAPPPQDLPVRPPATDAALPRAAAPGDLEVTPAEPWVLTGPVGGPFEPASRTYVLVNRGSAPVSWRVSSWRPGVRWPVTRGELAPGEEARVTAELDLGLVRSRGPGTYHTAAVFEVGGRTVRVAEVELRVLAPQGGAVLGKRSSLTSFGITWSFAGEHEAGSYVNGDPWVVGPVSIVAIEPGSQRRGERVVNGSMLNPSPRNGRRQGYDSTMYGQYWDEQAYDPALNVALGVTAEQPLVVPPGSSLVSSISMPQAGDRPQLRTAAVLTIVDAPPPADAFRPPYCGKDKTPRFRAGQLRTDLLARLEPVPATPPLARVERWFERPWIDHVPSWFGSAFTHPEENLPNYGRELVDQVGQASLMLNLDFTDEEKRTLLVRFVQVGIDFHGILRDGGRSNWQSGAGWCHGRKWTILFSGMLLDDPEMSGVGMDPALLFQGEDGQTFYVEETSPGVYNHGNGGYGPQHVGMAEWGIKHSTVPTDDKLAWNAPYRECCTANAWWGEVLAARIVPGARELWNHPPLFDYQDRYFDVVRRNGSDDWIVSWSEFPIQMWKRYRPDH